MTTPRDSEVPGELDRMLARAEQALEDVIACAPHYHPNTPEARLAQALHRAKSGIRDALRVAEVLARKPASMKQACNECNAVDLPLDENGYCAPCAARQGNVE